ncbi:MAG TPA: hypothetical protein PK228_11390, partial [Saprospiraceae bacterium]|nr:hypothetical protein [Saprospiraceae bacterium]
KLENSYTVKTLQENYSELDELKRKLRREKAEEMPDKREITRLEREIELIELEIKANKFSPVRTSRDTFLGAGNLTNFEKPQLPTGSAQTDDAEN